jgi:hypothetical protein
MLARHVSFLAVDGQSSLLKDSTPNFGHSIPLSAVREDSRYCCQSELGLLSIRDAQNGGKTWSRGLGGSGSWKWKTRTRIFFPLAVAPEVVLCPWRRQTTLTSTSFGTGGREDLETVAVDRKRKGSMSLDANKMSYNVPSPGSRRVCRHPKLSSCAVGLSSYPPPHVLYRSPHSIRVAQRRDGLDSHHCQ